MSLNLLHIFSLFSTFLLCQSVNHVQFEQFEKALSDHHFTLINYRVYWSAASNEFDSIFNQVQEELSVSHPEIFVGAADSSSELRFGEKFHILTFPTVRLFIKGVEYPIQYNGRSDKDSLLNWIKRKITSNSVEVNSQDATIASSRKHKLSLLFLGSSQSEAYKQFLELGRHYDDIDILNTDNDEVKKNYGVEGEGLVVLKNEGQESKVYSKKKMNFEAMRRFVNGQIYNEVSNFDDSIRHRIFEAGEDIVLLLKGEDENGKHAEEAFRNIAAELKDEIGFAVAHVGDGHDIEVKFYDLFKSTLLSIAEVAHEELPVVAIIQHKDRTRKYLMEHEIHEEDIKHFVEGFLNGKIKPFIKSAPTPDQPYDDNVRVLVGKTYSGVVYNKNYDVLVSLCAPRSQDCQPTYDALNTIAGKLKDVDDIMIARMDTYVNDVDIMEHIGLPAIVLYPKANKQQYVVFDKDITKLRLVEFLQGFNPRVNLGQLKQDPDLKESRRVINNEL